MSSLMEFRILNSWIIFLYQQTKLTLVLVSIGLGKANITIVITVIMKKDPVY